ncbi:hypothetical protein DM860_017107 [Cuscuta australis]|uniref:FBD domain-containing protein n=2 Tax=Cuscuta sect. Cleistogrammica TaxID=1824901 RepID=A0A328DNL1_9ASTE|nr:hypothetical protein DM860_017107 [Cuscuta australis]
MLRSLSLDKCHNLYHTVVSSQSPVHFVCKDLTKVRMDTPNLEFISHDSIDPITFVCKGPTFKLKDAYIDLILDNRGEKWFNGLLKFLAKLRWTETLSLCVDSERDVIIPEMLRMKRRPPLYSVKHLKIELYVSRLKNSFELIRSLLRLAPCPETISICIYGSLALNKKLTAGTPIP